LNGACRSATHARSTTGATTESKAEQAGDSASLEWLARGGLIAYGVVHLLVGWLALQIAWGILHRKDQHLVDVPHDPHRRAATGTGRIHRQGRGLSVVGGLLTYATLTFDRQQAQGLDGALQTILAQPFGKFLLTAVALGFVAFGVFAILQSRYRRM
jgi:fatty-acid desaturase